MQQNTKIQTRQQTPSARRPAADATTFAAPLAKTRGAEFENRCSRRYIKTQKENMSRRKL